MEALEVGAEGATPKKAFHYHIACHPGQSWCNQNSTFFEKPFSTYSFDVVNKEMTSTTYSSTMAEQISLTIRKKVSLAILNPYIKVS